LSRRFFFVRNVLAVLPLGFALLSTRWEWENGWATWSLAAILCAAGIVVRSWASTHCNYAQGKGKHLALTGPYALARNPLYIGNLIIIAGATFASALAWLVPVTVLWAWAVYATVSLLYEEPRLLRWYGEEYRRYRLAVPAWIPERIGGALMGPLSRRALLSESLRVLALLPFVLKELHWFSLGSG